MTCDKIMKGVIVGKTVSVPVQIIQSNKQPPHILQAAPMGNKYEPEGL